MASLAGARFGSRDLRRGEDGYLVPSRSRRFDEVASRRGSRAAGSPRVDRRLLKIWLPVFLCFATVVALTSGGADGIWGAWAAGGYGLACIAVWLSRRLGPPLLLAFVGALVHPDGPTGAGWAGDGRHERVVRSAHLLAATRKPLPSRRQSRLLALIRPLPARDGGFRPAACSRACQACSATRGRGSWR